MLSGILSIGTARPETVFEQHDLRRLYMNEGSATLRPDTLSLIDKVFDPSNGIETRALACSEPADLAVETLDETHQRYTRRGVELGAAALCEALRQAEVAGEDLAALVCCTCTGYLCPGLTSYLAEAVGLQPDAKYFDLVGMGCAASLPGLDLASQLGRAAPGRPVAVVAVEVCSATVSFDEEPGLVVSNALFGDGAGAAVLAGATPGRVELLDFASTMRVEYRDLLRFRQSDGRLKNCLHPDVPVLAAHVARDTIGPLLACNGFTHSDVKHWVVHPGGKKVLQKFAAALELAPEALADSYHVLRTCGNMSSPSVLFVLRSLLDRGDAGADEIGVCIAFGAGFSCHAALFRVGQGMQSETDRV